MLKEVRAPGQVHLAANRQSCRFKFRGLMSNWFSFYYTAKNKKPPPPNSCYRNSVFCSWLQDFLSFMTLPYRSELGPNSFAEKQGQHPRARVLETAGASICTGRCGHC